MSICHKNAAENHETEATRKSLYLVLKFVVHLNGISSVLEVMASSIKETFTTQVTDQNHLLEMLWRQKKVYLPSFFQAPKLMLVSFSFQKLSCISKFVFYMHVETSNLDSWHSHNWILCREILRYIFINQAESWRLLRKVYPVFQLNFRCKYILYRY